MNSIEQRLNALKDENYKSLQSKLIPNVPSEAFIGVRTPALRKLAKEISREDICETFLSSLPHKTFDENQLHGFIVSEIKDFDLCVKRLGEFLPYIDNWATCDQTSPKCFKKHAERLVPYIEKWICSSHTYTVRFAVGMLMQHFLDERFRPEYAKTVAEIDSEEYYINMERAWYMATALAKQWDSAVKIVENNVMDKWTHNKSIQKAVESRRVTDEQKAYLRGLKRR